MLKKPTFRFPVISEDADPSIQPIRDALRLWAHNVEIGDLLARIRNFRKLDIKRLSRSEISDELKKLLRFGAIEDNSIPISFCWGRTLHLGQYFYRVRSISQQRSCVPLLDMRTEADAWEPPPAFVRTQRLNQAGEPLLYTSMDPSVALEETKVSHGDIVPIMVYETIAPLDVTCIGLPLTDLGLEAQERMKVEMIGDFLRDEFTRDVGIGTEHLYKTSDILAKEYFRIPEHIHDGWEYPSIATKGGYNYCFKPHRARSKLDLLGFIVAEVRVVEERFKFRPLMVARGFDSNGNFHYHRIGSPAYDRLMRDFRKRG